MASSVKDQIFSRTTRKTPERSNFVQTCNLLSQYLKDMRLNGESLSFGLSCKLENKEKPEMFQQNTMNLLKNMENPAENYGQNVAVSSSFAKPIDLVALTSTEDSDKADFRKSAKEESETAQVTILYAGKVMVFNDFRAEKAKAIMALARKEDLSKPSSSFSNIDLNKTDSDNYMLTEQNNDQEFLRQGSQNLQLPINGSDLPIARKASLHRFLNKRKERVAAKAPYPLVSKRYSPPTKPEEVHYIRNKEEGQCFSKQLELIACSHLD